MTPARTHARYSVRLFVCPTDRPSVRPSAETKFEKNKKKNTWVSRSQNPAGPETHVAFFFVFENWY